ncbi:NAD-dependent malic enzyme [Granulicoccus phenolivorans]|uniref:NAD-dependent malic enzyme n=1 Tax=Granulicoccus phenolivorans TaxID=266854 RepID=UPI0004153B6A|nr:NAD-dependent malic enzyme [Granulicoccus phenolivorans]
MARQFQFLNTPEGEVVEIAVRGRQITTRPMINFGTGYTREERHALGLNGVLPPAVTPIETQEKVAYSQYQKQPDNLSRYTFLMSLQDRNEVLFYRVLAEHLDEMLPIIYTPTIGQAIQEFSSWFNVPRGAFCSIDDIDNLDEALRSSNQGPDDIDLIVVTDSEGILGIGDQGVGGIRIAVGKLSVYTAAAGIHPLRVLPVVLDVGTDNLSLLHDPTYLGARHARVRGERYDEFVAAFVESATRLYPKAMLHWEDFGASNAHRILETYRDQHCTFNDDIQGTAAVVAAAVLSAVRANGERLSDQRVIIHGAGTAGVGIADLLREEMVREGTDPAEAYRKFWGMGSRGLIHTGGKMRPFQEPYARPAEELRDWQVAVPGEYRLLDVVQNVRPTILIGTSAQPGSFTEQVVREMAAHTERPIILPLSNPTSLAEANPTDLLEWTDGRARIATGSPFPKVEYNGVTHTIAQANNALVFPGLGLGVIACRATRINDEMIAAAARVVAENTDASKPGSGLLPSMDTVRAVSAMVAVAVVEAAEKTGVATVHLANPIQDVFQLMWNPVYPKVKAVVNEFTPKPKNPN